MSYPSSPMHSVSLSFCLHLSLSVNGWMAIQPCTSHSNYHSAIHTQKYNYFLFWNVSSFSIKRRENFWIAKWQFRRTHVIRPFTLKLKRKRNPRHSKHVHHVLFSVDRSFKASWGSFLILRAELEGFEELVRVGVWVFSFIISASDLPLRSVDDMAAMLAPYRGG